MKETASILHTREEAARILSITRRMLANMIRDGLARETRIYGVSRIHQDEIERIAREGTTRQDEADDDKHPPDPRNSEIDEDDGKAEAKEE